MKWSIQALNQDFHTRGKRIEEQVEVLRKLWTEPLVTYQGRWHTIPDAGIKPLPVQRPIPIWFGGSVEAAVERAARLGDGWLPNFRSYADAQSALDTIRRTLEKAGPRSRGVWDRAPPGLWRRQPGRVGIGDEKLAVRWRDRVLVQYDESWLRYPGSAP